LMDMSSAQTSEYLKHVGFNVKGINNAYS